MSRDKFGKEQLKKSREKATNEAQEVMMREQDLKRQSGLGQISSNDAQCATDSKYGTWKMCETNDGLTKISLDLNRSVKKILIELRDGSREGCCQAVMDETDETGSNLVSMSRLSKSCGYQDFCQNLNAKVESTECLYFRNSGSDCSNSDPVTVEENVVPLTVENLRRFSRSLDCDDFRSMKYAAVSNYASPRHSREISESLDRHARDTGNFQISFQEQLRQQLIRSEIGHPKVNDLIRFFSNAAPCKMDTGK